ncbi:branched-chain amino acid transporter II carrier protein, partial [Staphylococcus simulans]
NRHYAYIFTITLYLVIGPIYALPRLASTSFEVGLSPFISQSLYKPFLFIFSLLFFILTWVFSRNTAKILEYIGKILNPIFVFLLSIILTLSFLQPMGTITSGSISNEYKQTPFFKGFVDGYNTLDALAALAFGMIIVKTIKDMGISEPLNITRETIKSGAISMVLMALIYSLLAIIGSMSLGEFEPHENGGITLTLIIKYYIGE